MGIICETKYVGEIQNAVKTKYGPFSDDQKHRQAENWSCCRLFEMLLFYRTYHLLKQQVKKLIKLIDKWPKPD